MKFNIVVNDGNGISTFDLDNASVSIGRSSDNDIQLNDKHVSRNHSTKLASLNDTKSI